MGTTPDGGVGGRPGIRLRGGRAESDPVIAGGATTGNQCDEGEMLAVDSQGQHESQSHHKHASGAGHRRVPRVTGCRADRISSLSACRGGGPGARCG